MSWLPLAIITAAAFGLYNVFIKVGSSRIDHVLGAVVLQFVAAVLGGLYALYLRSEGREFTITGSGIAWAAAAGVAIGVAEILSFAVYARGAPSSFGTPIIMGGSIMVAGLIGVFVLREQMGLAQAVGVALVIGGVALISAGARG